MKCQQRLVLSDQSFARRNHVSFDRRLGDTSDLRLVGEDLAERQARCVVNREDGRDESG